MRAAALMPLCVYCHFSPGSYCIGAASHSVSRSASVLASWAAGPGASPVERLLAERAAYCRFDLQAADVAVEACGYAETTRATLDYRERGRERSERRYLQALTALARVRKLDLRGVQINIAGRQVNQQVIDPSAPPLDP